MKDLKLKYLIQPLSKEINNEVVDAHEKEIAEMCGFDEVSIGSGSIQFTIGDRFKSGHQSWSVRVNELAVVGKKIEVSTSGTISTPDTVARMCEAFLKLQKTEVWDDFQTLAAATPSFYEMEIDDHRIMYRKVFVEKLGKEVKVTDKGTQDRKLNDEANGQFYCFVPYEDFIYMNDRLFEVYINEKY